MQLPAFFGSKKTINLLPKDSFESSLAGMILEWALAFGKWVVILTQFVVMVVVLWKFTLDRQLTDLRKEIKQESAVISSYAEMEEEFLLTQKTINFAKPVLASQKALSEVLVLIQSLTPTDVWFEKLSISDSGVSFAAYSASLSGFSRFLTAIQSEKTFSAVRIQSIESGGVEGAALKFEMSLGYGETKK